MKLDVKSNIAQVLRQHDSVRRDVVDKAVPRALNRCGDMAVTQTSRIIREEGYAFKAGEIKAAIRLTKARAGLRTVVIRTRRNTKSLIEFSARETKAGVMVKVHGAAKLIKGAFIAQRQNGVTGVYVEDKSAGKIIIRRQKEYKRGSKGGWHAYPARKLYGPSVGGVSASPRVEELLQAFVLETFAKRLDHEIRLPVPLSRRCMDGVHSVSLASNRSATHDRKKPSMAKARGKFWVLPARFERGGHDPDFCLLLAFAGGP